MSSIVKLLEEAGIPREYIKDVSRTERGEYVIWLEIPASEVVEYLKSLIKDERTKELAEQDKLLRELASKGVLRWRIRITPEGRVYMSYVTYKTLPEVKSEVELAKLIFLLGPLTRALMKGWKEKIRELVELAKKLEVTEREKLYA